MHLWPEKGTFRPTVVLGANCWSRYTGYAAESVVRARLSHRCLPSNKTGAHWVCVTPHETMSLCNCSHQLCKNIPVSFDFITTWNQGVFLCSPCIRARGREREEINKQIMKNEETKWQGMDVFCSIITRIRCFGIQKIGRNWWSGRRRERNSWPGWFVL